MARLHTYIQTSRQWYAKPWRPVMGRELPRSSLIRRRIHTSCLVPGYKPNRFIFRCRHAFRTSIAPPIEWCTLFSNQQNHIKRRKATSKFKDMLDNLRIRNRRVLGFVLLPLRHDPLEGRVVSSHQPFIKDRRCGPDDTAGRKQKGPVIDQP